jgi:hypothetical protein
MVCITDTISRFILTSHLKGSTVRVAPNEVDFSDISAAKEIHRVGSGFLKSVWYQNLTLKAGTNIFNIINPKEHGVRRRLLSAPISDSSLKLMESLINEKVSLAIQKIKEEMECRGAADVFKWWMFMASDVIGQLSFGDSFGMLERGIVRS